MFVAHSQLKLSLFFCQTQLGTVSGINVLLGRNFYLFFLHQLESWFECKNLKSKNRFVVNEDHKLSSHLKYTLLVVYLSS